MGTRRREGCPAWSDVDKDVMTQSTTYARRHCCDDERSIICGCSCTQGIQTYLGVNINRHPFLTLKQLIATDFFPDTLETLRGLIRQQDEQLRGLNDEIMQLNLRIDS